MKMTSFLRCWEPQPPLLACCLLWGLNGPLAPPQWPLCGRCVHLGDDDHPAKITFWQSGGVVAHGVCTQIPPRCLPRWLLVGWLLMECTVKKKPPNLLGWFIDPFPRKSRLQRTNSQRLHWCTLMSLAQTCSWLAGARQ